MSHGMISKPIRISGKNLGMLAQPDCCLRCFWLKLRMGFKLPFSIFPGIFSTIDAYTKQVVHGYFDQRGRPPPWLADLGDLVGYIEPPNYRRFNFVDERTGILLTGAPDGLLVRRNGTLVICDYKTARYTNAQDALFPVYETQLNAYAMITERCGLGRVSALVLLYFEPLTEPEAILAQIGCNHGFNLSFGTHVVSVNIRPELIEHLLVKTSEIANLSSQPPGTEACQNCVLLSNLHRLLIGRGDSF